MIWRLQRYSRAFTLVELLVVIGIIALLIAILLPTLARARRSANTVKCAANLRSIMQAVHLYASANHDYYPGGSQSTGRHLFTANWGTNPAFSNANCPNIVQVGDWMSPLAQVMGIAIETGPSVAERLARFEALRTHPAFTCPENAVMATAYTASGGPACKTDIIVSYAIATQFQLGDASIGGSAGTTRGSPDLTSPAGWAPKLGKVANATRKIFIADGARYSNTSTSPDIDLNYNGSGGGAFGDVGAFTTRSNCWNRSLSPGNGGSGTIDARVFSFRHGTTEICKRGGEYRFNAGFFDGHVEALNDLEASDPSLWLPTGSFYDPNGGNGFKMHKDAEALYGSGARTIP